MSKPWTLVSPGAPVDYTILRVREMKVRHPSDGSLHDRVRIEAPDWVQVLAFTPDDEVVLVRQFRAGIWSETLEVPGGIVDPHEGPRAAAERELLEETGYRPERLEPIGACHPNPAIQTNQSHAFLAQGCVKVAEPKLDAGEDLCVELHPRSGLPALVRAGKITHALVLAALFYEHLRQEAAGTD